MAEYNYRSSGLDTAVSSALDTFTKLRAMRNERERVEMEREKIGMDRERMGMDRERLGIDRMRAEGDAAYQKGMLKYNQDNLGLEADKFEETKNNNKFEREQKVLLNKSSIARDAALNEQARASAAQANLAIRLTSEEDARNAKLREAEARGHLLSNGGNIFAAPGYGAEGQAQIDYVNALRSQDIETVAKAAASLGVEKGVDLTAFADTQKARGMLSILKMGAEGMIHQNHPDFLAAVNYFYGPSINKGAGAQANGTKITKKELAGLYPSRDGKAMYAELRNWLDNGPFPQLGVGDNSYLAPATKNRRTDDNDLLEIPVDKAVQNIFALEQMLREIESNPSMPRLLSRPEVKQLITQNEAERLALGGKLEQPNWQSDGDGRLHNLTHPDNKGLPFVGDGKTGSTRAPTTEEMKKMDLQGILLENGIPLSETTIGRFRENISRFDTAQRQYLDFKENALNAIQGGEYDEKLFSKAEEIALEEVAEQIAEEKGSFIAGNPNRIGQVASDGQPRKALVTKAHREAAVEVLSAQRFKEMTQYDMPPQGDPITWAINVELSRIEQARKARDAASRPPAISAQAVESNPEQFTVVNKEEG